jgi:hypothetical protein
MDDDEQLSARVLPKVFRRKSKRDPVISSLII